MRTEKQIEHFIQCLRGLNTGEFPGQLKERAIARQTLWVMGMILIHPIVRRLAEANELHLIYPIAKLYLALGQLDHGWVPTMLCSPQRNPGDRWRAALHTKYGARRQRR